MNMFELENLKDAYMRMVDAMPCGRAGAGRVWWDADSNEVLTDSDIFDTYDSLPEEEKNEVTPDEYLWNFIDAVKKGRNDCFTFDEVEDMLNKKLEEEAWLNEDDEEDD